jgi:hypothetical protein
MESLEPWMVVGLLGIVYALMGVLWVMERKKSPKTILGPLVLDPGDHSAEPMADESFLQKWLRRLTTM